MGLRKREEKAAKTIEKSAPPAQGSQWTTGRALGQKAVTGALLIAVACGPLALVSATIAGQSKPAIAQAVVDAPLTAQQQAAGEYGAAFVAAWLSATNDDTGNLGTYVSTSAIAQLSKTAWTYRDLSVVSISKAEGSDLLSVVVGANVEELDVESEDGKSIWPRRYFSVAVHVTETTTNIVGLPAPVAAPVKGEEAVPLAYNQPVGKTSAAQETVEAFLGAYLAGSGDISRYITPGSAISAITPAPYMTLAVTDIKADVEPVDSPSTGSVTHVLATVEVASAREQMLTATYALTLTARDGRWETTSVDLTPLEYTAPSSSR